MTFFTPLHWKKVMLQFSAPPGPRGRDGIGTVKTSQNCSRALGDLWIKRANSPANCRATHSYFSPFFPPSGWDPWGLHPTDAPCRWVRPNPRCNVAIFCEMTSPHFVLSTNSRSCHKQRFGGFIDCSGFPIDLSHFLYSTYPSGGHTFDSYPDPEVKHHLKCF